VKWQRLVCGDAEFLNEFWEKNRHDCARDQIGNEISDNQFISRLHAECWIALKESQRWVTSSTLMLLIHKLKIQAVAVLWLGYRQDSYFHGT
jgi:hypothetical protein